MTCSNRESAFRPADVTHGTNFDTEITPLHKREFPWTIEYKSPDYEHPLRDPEDAAIEDTERHQGFYIDIAQAAIGLEGRADGPRPFSGWWPSRAWSTSLRG